jgi:hypothetical protein
VIWDYQREVSRRGLFEVRISDGLSSLQHRGCFIKTPVRAGLVATAEQYRKTYFGEEKKISG